MSQKSILEIADSSYEKKRTLHKNGVFSGSFIFFKSTVGLGMLASQFFFGKAGLLLSTLVSLFLVLLIHYTMKLLTDIAKDMEAKDRNLSINTYDQMVGKVLGPYAQIFTKIACFEFNHAVIIINTINLSKFVMHSFTPLDGSPGLSLNAFKFIIIGLLLASLVIVIEPEKLKFTSYVSTIILVGGLIIMWVLNTEVWLNRPQPDFTLVDFNHFAAVVGNQLYAIEGVGTLFTIRSVLRERNKINQVMSVSFAIILLIFVGNGISFLVTYGDQGLHPMTFDYYPGSQLVNVIRWGFYITQPLSLLIFIVANTLEIENIDYIASKLKGPDDTMSIPRLLCFRIFLCFFMLCPIFFIHDEFLLMVITGVILIPSIGFLIPILADLKYFDKQSSMSRLWKWTLLFFSMALNIVTSVVTIHHTTDGLQSPTSLHNYD